MKLGYTQIIKVGEQLGTFYGYKTAGIWQADDPELNTARQFGNPVYAGQLKILDFTSDGDVTDVDRRIIGYAQPTFFGGIHNNLSYKGFDWSVFFQFSINNDVLNAVKRQTTNTSSYQNKLKDMVGNTWTVDHPDAKYPTVGSAQPEAVYDTMIEDGSFLRMREITIGYTLPRSFLHKCRIDKIRIYATAANLLTFTRYSGYDPEVNIFGGDNIEYISTDNGSYPRAKSVVVGLNVTF